MSGWFRLDRRAKNCGSLENENVVPSEIAYAQNSTVCVARKSGASNIH